MAMQVQIKELYDAATSSITVNDDLVKKVRSIKIAAAACGEALAPIYGAQQAPCVEA